MGFRGFGGLGALGGLDFCQAAREGITTRTRSWQLAQRAMITRVMDQNVRATTRATRPARRIGMESIMHSMLGRW